MSAVGFSTDGVYAAAGSLAGELAVWNVGSGERVHLLEGPEDITVTCSCSAHVHDVG